jgi:hypothetical protein
MKNRKYNVVAINKKTEMVTKCNKIPMTHGEACTFKSKFTYHPLRSIEIVLAGSS